MSLYQVNFNVRRVSLNNTQVCCLQLPLGNGWKQNDLLYLPTQIRFLIGGERVTCHWSKLNDALGRTKLNDALGEQQLELWTRT